MVVMVAALLFWLASAEALVPSGGTPRMARASSLEAGPSALASAPREPLSFAFSPAGLLFPFYVGVAYELQAIGLLTARTPVGGSSAGSIVAAALACGLSEAEVRAGLASLVRDVRGGTSLKAALRSQLATLLPDDAAERATARGITLCYTAVLPWPRRHLVTEWSCKQDLIDVITASCNWPFYLSRWPLVRCRGAWAVDGFFAVGRERFGCPPLDAVREVAVTALPRVPVAAYGDDDLIQAGKRRALPISLDKWLRWAYTPALDAELEMLVDVGREHAREWAEADAERARGARGRREVED